jgi:hypothetical protein
MPFRSFGANSQMSAVLESTAVREAGWPLAISMAATHFCVRALQFPGVNEPDGLIAQQLLPHAVTHN